MGLQQVVFKSRGRILFLQVSDIRCIYPEGNHVRICTGSETHLLRETMTSLEQRLDSTLFQRVHRSAIVNLQHVKEITSEANCGATVLLDNGERVPISRSHRSRIEKLLRS